MDGSGAQRRSGGRGLSALFLSSPLLETDGGEDAAFRGTGAGPSLRG